LSISHNLPKGDNTYLSIPKISDMDEFLYSVKDSIDLHYPWVEAPYNEDKYNQYIKRINFESHIGFFINVVDCP
jgi:hypothetical protein